MSSESICPWATALVLCLPLFSCQCNESKQVDAPPDRVPIRIAGPVQYYGDGELDIMIVGNRGSLEVAQVILAKGQVVDDGGTPIDLHIERHPGPASKYGPYVLLKFDPDSAPGPINLTAIVRYKGSHYRVSGRFVKEEAHKMHRWRSEQVRIVKSGVP
jgi:hypothetical protein